MALLSWSYILLVALVQNVFYIYAPYNSSNAWIMVETKESASNNTWLKLQYETTDTRHAGLFKTIVPTSTFRYKVKLQYRDHTFGETEWKTMMNQMTEPCENVTIPKIPTAVNQSEDDYYSLILFTAISCSILVLRLVYKIALALYIRNK